jgi:hypothetical protein
MRRIAAVAATLLLMAALVWASAAPLTVQPPARSLLRLAWSARPERIEDCRQRTEAELAQLPQHMRQPMVCEGRTAEYDLTVRRNGQLVLQRRLHGAGLRRDRRLYVLEEIGVDPGVSNVEVAFDRVGGPGSAAAAAASRGSDNAPPHLAFTERFEVSAGEVVLITYSTEQGALVARRRGL